MIDVTNLTPEQKLDLFNRDRRIQALIERLGVRLADCGYTWEDEERKAFDWASRTLDKDITALAA